MSSIRFYSKAGCHLCDEGLEKAVRVAARAGLAVEKIDIGDDPELLERHGKRIPVVELDGEELAWGRISEKGLTLALRSHLGGK